MRSPLFFSESLYNWDPASSGEHVSFDELHQRVVHHKTDGFFAVDLIEEGDSPDGLFVKFDANSVRSVRFSPDGMFFAYLSKKCTMGCVETLHPTRAPISLTLKGVRADTEVLNFFWLPAMPQHTDSADLVVISDLGVEMFRVFFETRSVKSLKAFFLAVRLCWAEPTSGMVLTCIGAHSLQPFDLRLKVPQKMSKFDLVVAKGKAIEANDVVVMSLYDTTYCIHADALNGRVSLRNMSNPSQGTPERDIVINVSDAVGMLRLSKVDNFLIVHCLERAASIIYDIRHRDASSVPIICGPLEIETTSEHPVPGSWTDLLYVSGSTIIDPTCGNVFRLKLKMDLVLRDFSARTPHELSTVIRLLLRRTNCREHIVDLLQRALASNSSFSELSQAFAVANHAYRIAIEALSSRNSSGQTRQNTVSLQLLESVIGQQSILSEKDMVAQVFYPHFITISGKDGVQPSASEVACKSSGSQESTNHDGEGVRASNTGENEGPVLHESWRIPLRPVTEKGIASNADRKEGGCPGRSPHLVSVAVAYLRSLLSMQILPHKILQCFVFDICMYFDQEHTLQQLLQYNVLLDSPDLLMRLKEVACSRSCTWAIQAFLDMAHRLQDHCAVAEMLVHARLYLDVVPFLLNQQVVSFKLSDLLQRVSEDVETQKRDPDLIKHLVADIQMWRQEALADPGVCVAPALDGCEKWLPPEVLR
eukprot:TRINITY_DN67195_c0_g1_i1.p1 TRINITY_DN67195_c0_g1~~TRINITY_DN67195_c0_g1_i1.p1  ORF type:complete len:705 (-),score=97.53 TRINITY_DN67195_c0_g1_i1:51-2165(-)